MNTRLQILMSRENLSASKLANFIGVQPSAISHILSGRNKPSYDFILRLATAFPAYSLEWLLLGTEPMLKAEHNVSVYGSEINEIAAATPAVSDAGVTTEKTTPSVIKSLENPEQRLFEFETVEKKNENSVESKSLQNSIQVEKNTVLKEAMTEKNNEASEEPCYGGINEAETVSKRRCDSRESIGRPLCNITKVMLFYEDNTFESYTARNAK